MPLINDAYLQFRDGQTYQPKQVDPGVVTKISWEYQEQGGLAQIAATLAVAWETTPVLPGDYMEVWALGETVPRARGIVSTPENRLDLKESKTLLAFGRMADMDKTLLYKQMFHPSGSPQDLSYYAAEMLADYSQRKAVGGGFAPMLDIDFQVIGANLESLTLSPGSVRSGFDQLYSQTGGSVVWGWDIHPVTGNDRCFLRRRQFSVGTQFFVGDKVKLLTAPAELAPVTNAVYLKGAPAKYPNLLTNASFEQPTNPSADSGSSLINGGFEFGNPNHSANPGGEGDCLGWNMNGNVTRNQHDAGTGHNASAHTGDWYLLLDNTGKNATQDVAVTVGTAYLGTAFVRAENASHLPVGAMTVTGRDSSGNLTETPQGGSLTLASASVTWTGGAASSAVGSDALQTSLVFTNPATVKARITISYASGSGGGYGLCVDDVTFGPVGSVGQYGWGTHLQNPGNAGNAFNSVIWACKAAAFDGAYGIRCAVTASQNNRPALAPAGQDNSGDSRFHFKPIGQQALQVGFFARMTPGQNSGAGALACEYREWAGDGHETQFQAANLNNQSANIPNDGLWHLVTLSVQAHGDASSATMQCTFGASGTYDLDGFFVRDAAAGVVQAQEPQAANYLRGADFERYVTAEAVCTSGSLVDQTAAASAATWGRREAVLTNDQTSDWTPDAKAYLQSWFGRNAVLLQRPRLEITGDWSQVPTPCDGMQIAVNGTRADILPQWCSHAAYTSERQTLSISLDLSNERPTVAKMLKAAQASGGSAGSSVGAPTGSGQTGASTPTPTYRQTLQGSATDPTLHDAYTGVPHASAASQAGWATTSNEVVAARTRTVKGTSGLSLEARLDAMEADILAGGTAATAAGFVDYEVPTGTQDGINQGFTLKKTPAAGLLRIFLRGLLMAPGIDFNYNAGSGALTMLNVVFPGDDFFACYVVSSGGLNFVAYEVPAGTLDSVRTAFPLAHTPTPGSLQVYLRGAINGPVAWTLSGNTLTMATPPDAGNDFFVFYKY